MGAGAAEVIWVTGASSGIGAAIARRLAAEGYHVVISARRRLPLYRLARSASQRLHALPCNCADESAVATAVAHIEERFGQLDGLVLCAGSALFKPFAESSSEEFEALLDSTLRTVFFCTRAVLPLMRRQQRGVVLFLSSVATLKAFPNCALYGGLKAAAAHMLRALREEVRSEGIKVVNVHVGATDTPLWDPAVRRRWRQRMLHPDDVADAVAALLRLSARRQLLPEELILRPQLGDLP